MHLFLTGAKGVGKSTLLNAIAAAVPGAKGGFRTVRLNTFLPGRYTVHLFSPGEPQVPGAENLLFVCNEPVPDPAERFALLGCGALCRSRGAALLLMDELGPHEGNAAPFREAVLAALAGDTPILGVLQEAPSPFLAEVARHPKVSVLRVTMENRDALARQIPKWIELLHTGKGGIP